MFGAQTSGQGPRAERPYRPVSDTARGQLAARRDKTNACS
jgi:hypothetical protein